jgi:phage-related protein
MGLTEYTVALIEEVQQILVTYLKHLEGIDGLYEISVQSGSEIFRVFYFFDEGIFVIAMNGFQKKTQKTPRKEIDKALAIRREYYAEKKQF